MILIFCCRNINDLVLAMRCIFWALLFLIIFVANCVLWNLIFRISCLQIKSLFSLFSLLNEYHSHLQKEILRLTSCEILPQYSKYLLFQNSSILLKFQEQNIVVIQQVYLIKNFYHLFLLQIRNQPIWLDQNPFFSQK